MSEAAVVDASPLIYLAHSSLIDLLQVASPQILGMYLSNAVLSRALALVGE